MIDKETPLAKLLISDEGWEASAYEDSLGWLTIGVGHLIDKRKGGRLSDNIILSILDEDVAEKSRHLDAWLSWWRELSPPRQAVLLSMTFNIGIGNPNLGTGVLGFKRMLGATHAKNFTAAAQNLSDSPRWRSQVGDKRVDRLCHMLETGAWPAL